SANSPAEIPCPAGPTTDAAVITPVTVPEGVGHAGVPAGPLPRVVQRNAETPPATARAPQWMCDCVTVPPAGLASNGPEYVSVNVMALPARLSDALNTPLPAVDNVGISSY